MQIESLHDRFHDLLHFLSLPSPVDAITHSKSVWLCQESVKLSSESIHKVWGRVVTSEKLILWLLVYWSPFWTRRLSFVVSTIIMVVCGSIKIKKIPSPAVWDRNIFLKCRMASRFVSAFRYDHNEDCKYTWYVLAPNKNFLKTTQAILKLPLREFQKILLCEEDVCPWVVSKSPKSFCWDLSATKSHVCLQAFSGSHLNAETNGDAIRHFKKFFRSQTSGDGTFWILILSHTTIYTGSKK